MRNIHLIREVPDVARLRDVTTLPAEKDIQTSPTDDITLWGSLGVQPVSGHCLGSAFFPQEGGKLLRIEAPHAPEEGKDIHGQPPRKGSPFPERFEQSSLS
jgi:hypothetical protein